MVAGDRAGRADPAARLEGPVRAARRGTGDAVPVRAGRVRAARAGRRDREPGLAAGAPRLPRRAGRLAGPAGAAARSPGAVAGRRQAEPAAPCSTGCWRRTTRANAGRARRGRGRLRAYRLVLETRPPRWPRTWRLSMISFRVGRLGASRAGRRRSGRPARQRRGHAAPAARLNELTARFAGLGLAPLLDEARDADPDALAVDVRPLLVRVDPRPLSLSPTRGSGRSTGRCTAGPPPTTGPATTRTSAATATPGAAGGGRARRGRARRVPGGEPAGRAAGQPEAPAPADPAALRRRAAHDDRAEAVLGDEPARGVPAAARRRAVLRRRGVRRGVSRSRRPTRCRRSCGRGRSWSPATSTSSRRPRSSPPPTSTTTPARHHRRGRDRSGADQRVRVDARCAIGAAARVHAALALPQPRRAADRVLERVDLRPVAGDVPRRGRRRLRVVRAGRRRRRVHGGQCRRRGDPCGVAGAVARRRAPRRVTGRHHDGHRARRADLVGAAFGAARRCGPPRAARLLRRESPGAVLRQEPGAGAGRRAGRDHPVDRVREDGRRAAAVPVRPVAAARRAPAAQRGRHPGPAPDDAGLLVPVG